MALLLAMYQKMRLIREINQESLNLTRFSSKVDRIAKNISNVQKMYEGRMKSLESQAKIMQSQASVFFQNQFHIGANSVNPYNYSGMNEYVYNVIGSMMCQGGYQYKNADGEVMKLDGMSQEDVQAMMNEYMANGRFLQAPDPDNEGQYLPNQYENWSPEQVAAFMQAMRQGQMAQSQAQMQCQQVSTQYQNNVSIWLEAQKAQLEAEQDQALEPLSYEQSMMEIDKEASEERLTRLKAELQSYKELCKQEAQDAAPKFGLG